MVDFENTAAPDPADTPQVDAAGRFLPGNRMWEARSCVGAKPKYDSPEMLWEACVRYFEWVEANPLKEAKVVQDAGRPVVISIDRMRAMTIGGLCVFLGIVERTWREWRGSRPDLEDTIDRVDAIIREQKFTGAAAGLLNASIIGRDLGLTNKVDHSSEDGSMTPPPKRSDQDVARSVAFLLARGLQDSEN